MTHVIQENRSMRPVNPENQYKVSIQKIRDYTYASTQPRVVDKKTGKVHYTRVHWGKVDENKKFIPGTKYIYASLEERKKLIFPDDWDLSEISKLSGMRRRGRPIIESQDENKLYGDIWLLEQIAESTGLRSDLLKVYHGNDELVDGLLTLAYYLISGKGGTFNQVSAWQHITKTPCDISLSATNITRITQSISNRDRMELFKLRAGRVGKNELCAVDSTSRATYGSSLADIKWGKSKDQVPLPQTVEVVVYALDTHTPIYYRSFPGNIPDSRSLKTIVGELESAGYKNLILITDRGYESIANLEYFIDKKQAVITGVKTRQKFILDKIKAFGEFNTLPENEMNIDTKERIYYKQYDLEYQIEGMRENVKTSDKLKLNLYFDPIRRSRELIDLDICRVEQAECLQEILDEKSPLDVDSRLKKHYWLYNLNYDEDTRTLTAFSLNEKKYKMSRTVAGFFANLTQCLDLNAMEANHHYHLRDEQEKYFTNMKTLLHYDRTRAWSEDGKDGREFILFLAQILLCNLKHIHKIKLQDEFKSVTDILNEMRAIRYIEHPNKQPFITPFISKQITICEAFGFEIPDGCAPEYVTKKTNKGKRGRPRKNKFVIKDN